MRSASTKLTILFVFLLFTVLGCRMQESYIYILGFNFLLLFLSFANKNNYFNIKEWLIFVLSIIYNFYSYFVLNSDKLLLFRYFLIITTYIFFISVIRRGYLSYVLKYCYIMITIILSVAIIEKITGKNIFYNLFYAKLASYAESSTGIVSNMGHSLILASFVVIIITILINIKNKRISSVLIVISLLVAYWTEKRTGMIVASISVIFTALIYCLKVRKTKKNINSIIKIICIIIICIIIVMQVKINDLTIWQSVESKFVELNTVSGEGSLINRLDSWIKVPGLFFESSRINILFGNGYGALIKDITYSGISFGNDGFTTVDNTYLSLMYDLGIVILICFIVNVLKLICRLWKNIKKVKKDNKNFLLSISCMVCLIVMLLTILLFDAFTWVYISFELGLLLAISIGILENKLDDHKKQFLTLDKGEKYE